MDIQITLKGFEDRLIQADKHVPLVKGWKDDFPKEGGVYVLWEDDLPVYVGETSGLKARMSDLSRPVNHPFTSKVVNKYLLYEAPIEEIRSYIANRYQLSYLILSLGRAEVEEYLILRWRRTLINKPTKRVLDGAQYHWVKAA